VLTGLYTPDSGTFELAGKAYQPSAVHEVAKAGIARTFQNIRLFAEMTALENVMVGRHIRTRSGLLGAIFRTPGFKAEEAAIAQRAQELLDYVSWRSTERGCQSQAQVAGITFDMVCNPEDPHAANIVINGIPLDLDGTYELATNDYIAHGGSGFEVLERNTTQVDTGISIRDVVKSAIIQYHTLPQVEAGICVEDGRINPVY
jgi:ABC-type sugar transport system ATPase subunit